MAVLTFGAQQVIDGKLTAGQLSSFVVYSLYVSGNVGQLAGVFSSLIQARASPHHHWNSISMLSNPMQAAADPVSLAEGAAPTVSPGICGGTNKNSTESLCRKSALILARLSGLQAVGASERVFELLDRGTHMDLSAGSRKPVGAAEGGHIQLHNVWCLLCPLASFSCPCTCFRSARACDMKSAVAIGNTLRKPSAVTLSLGRPCAPADCPSQLRWKTSGRCSSVSFRFPYFPAAAGPGSLTQVIQVPFYHG